MRVQYATQTFKSVMHKVVGIIISTGSVLFLFYGWIQRTDSINHPSYVSRLLELKGGTNVSDEDLKLIKWSAAAMFGSKQDISTSVYALTICANI